MGCVVNGPGEIEGREHRISLPGTGEAPNCPVFIDGEQFTTLRGTYDELADGFRAPGGQLRGDALPPRAKPRERKGGPEGPPLRPSKGSPGRAKPRERRGGRT